MGFNNRTASPVGFFDSPTLPQADSSEAHNVPTAVSPTTAKLQDWIAFMAERSAYQIVQVETSQSYSFTHPAGAGSSIDPSFPVIELSDVQIGDVIIFDASGFASHSGTPATCAAYMEDEWDGAATVPTTRLLNILATGCFAFRRIWTVTDTPAGTWSTGIMRFYLGGSNVAGGSNMTWTGRVALSALHIRKS